jgi:phosphoserine phosphatase RsbU/P
MPNISDAEWQRLQHAVDELTALNEIATAVNVAMSVEQVTRITVELCLNRLNASQGAVFLTDSDSSKTDKFKTFVRSMNPSAQEMPFTLNMTLLGWMLKNKAMLVTNAPATDPRLRGVPFAKIGIRSLMAAPLLSLNGLLGVLAVFNKNDDTGFTDADAQFLNVVGAQTAKLIENVRLFDKEQQLRGLQREIQLAKEIQQGFLPKENLSLPWCEVFGSNSAAREVGGDFYDMLAVDDQVVFVSIGDVAGKGIPAALIMSNAQAVVRAQLLGGGHPDLTALVGSLNRLICQLTSPGQYITALFGYYDRSRGLFDYINCGHMPLLVLRRDGALESFPDSDPVVGVLPDLPFRTHQVPLAAGDAIFLYTDGVTECWNPAQEMFGEDRLKEALTACAGQPASGIVQSVTDQLAAYRGAAEQSDDITAVVLAPR